MHYLTINMYNSLTCASEPTMKELVLLHVNEWYNLGLQLDIGDGELETIKKNNPGDIAGCRRDMFRKWLRNNTSPSYTQLVEALVTIGEYGKADHLCKKFGKDTCLNFVTVSTTVSTC